MQQNEWLLFFPVEKRNKSVKSDGRNSRATLTPCPLCAGFPTCASRGGRPRRRKTNWIGRVRVGDQHMVLFSTRSSLPYDATAVVDTPPLSSRLAL